MVNIADNSGAKIGKVIHVWNKPNSSSIVRLSIQKVRKIKGDTPINRSNVKKSTVATDSRITTGTRELALGLMIRTNRNKFRLNHIRTRFFDNAAVLLDAANNHEATEHGIKGTRIFGPVTSSLRKSNSTAVLKVLSLAGGIV